MNTVRTSHTDAEIIAHSDMSWWDFERKTRQGSPARDERVYRKIERGPYVARRQSRDFLSEPIDWLAMPLHILRRP
jgi:hypothetical protein